MSSQGWSLGLHVDPGVPPLMWLARIPDGASDVEVTLGTSVQCAGDYVFEGTWAGDHGIGDVEQATTVFGSGIFVAGSHLVVVTPTHAMSGVYSARRHSGLVISNSLVALLEAAHLQLDRNADYPGRFGRVMEGVGNSPIEIPTTTDPVSFHFYRNLHIDSSGKVSEVAKPDEEPFVSFGEYRGRFSAAIGSALSNAGAREAAVSLSSGYDSTAVAVIAAENGCRQALTFRAGRVTKRNRGDIADSGEATAHRLGMNVDVFDRDAYLERDDLVEAEFLATGMSGEDVVMAAYEPCLRHGILLTGTQGNGIWKLGGNTRADLSRKALDGTALQEFRLRADFHFIPVPVFGMSQRPSVMAIAASAEMRPFSVGGGYDQPISRRIGEEAALPRDSFGVKKRAASAVIHAEGEATLSKASATDIRRFAAAEGTPVAYPVLRPEAVWQRAALEIGPRVGAGRFLTGLRWRHKRRSHFEPAIGNLLFRWGVSVTRPRYSSLDTADDST